MKKPSKTTIIRAAITVAVLAVAIVVGSLFAQSRRPSAPSTIQLTAAQRSQADYNDGVTALSKEDTAAAIVLFESALVADPGNTAARTKLAAVKKANAAATKPAPASTPATKPAEPAKPDPFLGSIELQKLIPTSLTGFVLGFAQIIDPDATLAAGPTAPDSTITNVVWAVHERKSESEAQKFVDGLRNGLYSKDASTVNVRGTTGYFGTDGTRLAAIVFRRGRYAFEVIVTSSGPPKSEKAIAEQAAAAFPSAP